MAQSERSGHKQRIQLKVIDVASGEEQISGDIVVVRGFCSWGCCCCNWPVVTPPRNGIIATHSE